MLHDPVTPEDGRSEDERSENLISCVEVHKVIETPRDLTFAWVRVHCAVAMITLWITALPTVLKLISGSILTNHRRQALSYTYF